MMSATCSNPSVRSRWRGELVLALDVTVNEVIGAARAQHHRTVLVGTDEQPSDVGVSSQRREEVGVPLLDLLEGQAPPLVHEIDEPEVAGAEDDDVLPADVVLLPLRPLARRVSGRLVERRADRRLALVAARDARYLAS